MAFLPILMDFVDEINSNLDDPKAFSAGIPLFLDSQGMRFHQRPMGHKKNGCPRTCSRGNCVAKPSSDDYQVRIDVKSFKPEEITVKVKGREILVEGKHEERQDEFGFVSQQFSRRYILPEEFDADTVSTFLSADGKMTIKALKPQPAIVEPTERVIPIQGVPKSSPTESLSTEPEQEKKKVQKITGKSTKNFEQSP